MKIDVRVTIDPLWENRWTLPGAGVLVVSWLERDRAEPVRMGSPPDASSIADLVSRSGVVRVRTVDLINGSGVPLEVPSDAFLAADVVPIAIFDHAGAFWACLLDGDGTALIGASDDGIHLLLHPVKRTDVQRKEQWGDRATYEYISHVRGSAEAYHLAVRLPLDYEPTSARRHPVVYLLPGLGGDERARFHDRSLISAADRQTELGRASPILVGINARTEFGSWYLTREETPWVRFLTGELFDVVHTRFRTLVDREHQILIGQSTGGFNAISLAMTHPKAFGSIVATAPDALDLEGWLLTSDGRIDDRWLAWMRLEDTLQGVGQMLSYAYSWSADGNDYRWPADLRTGETDQPVLERWLAQSPLRRLEEIGVEAALRSFDGRIFLGAAQLDEFGLFGPARQFQRRLLELNIPHEFMTYDAGHFDLTERLGDLMVASLG